ncbi:MAG: SH3 domain-containing protein [Spirochaetes bacterium]|nr:SH3 domain-containing protein [Spirochaetota bacterium]
MKRIRPVIGIIIISCIVALSCSKTEEKSRDVEVPELQKGCLSGQCVEGQFETTYRRFALVSGDGVKLRSKPGLKSRVIALLPVTRKVMVLHVKPDTVGIGGLTGRWAFVRDTTLLTREGWVFDHYLAFPSHFKKPTSLKIREIRVILGDTLSIFRCSPDGRFRGTPIGKGSPGDNNKNKEEIQGDILEYRDIVWLKNDKPDDYPIFFHRLDTKKFSLPDHYRNIRGTVITK